MTFLALFILITLAGAEEKVEVSALLNPDVLVPGGEAMLFIAATIPDGFHVYGLDSQVGIPISVELEDSSRFMPLGQLQEPEPDYHFDELMKVKVPWHSGTLKLRLPLQISTATAPGMLSLEGRFGFQLCDATSCRIPAETTFSVQLTVEGESAEAASPVGIIAPPPVLDITGAQADIQETPPSTDAESSEPKVLARFVGYEPSEKKFLSFLQLEASQEAQPGSKGFWTFIGAAIIAGLLSILTPCVFPMIPITVSFFSRMAGGGRRQMVGLAATYSGGIIFAYTAIGLIVSVALGASGVQDIATSPWLNLVLAAVLIFFTLNLLGMFEIRISTGGMGTPQREGACGKIVSVLLMALAFTLASFTCTAGFVGALLVAAAQGDVLWPLVGMLAYSTAFALPFFFLALFPSWLSSLPQSGGWMNRIKVTMGFLIFVAAFKFLSNADMVWNLNILKRETVLTVWVVSFLLLGLYLLGKIRLPHDAEQSAVSVPRLMIVLFSLALSLHLAFGLGGKEVWLPLNGLLPPEWYGKDIAKEHWPEDYDGALAEARQQDKLLFVDFSGYTCVNCKLMEHKVFSLPRIRTELDKFVRVRLYTDGGPDKKRNQRLAQSLGRSTALPLYVILDP